jgi:hypothetical protein
LGQWGYPHLRHRIFAEVACLKQPASSPYNFKPLVLKERGDMTLLPFLYGPRQHLSVPAINDFFRVRSLGFWPMRKVTERTA